MVDRREQLHVAGFHSAMRRATVSATLAWLALLITRSTVTIVPGRALITTAPADRAIHPADQRRAIGARYRAVRGSDRPRRSTSHGGMKAGTTCLTQGAQPIAGALTRSDPSGLITSYPSLIDPAAPMVGFFIGNRDRLSAICY